MDYGKLKAACAALVLVGVICGCAGKGEVKKPVPDLTEAALPPPPPPAVTLAPPAFSDSAFFSGRKFTLEARSASVGSVLFAIASDLGLNLVVDSDVNAEHALTVNFNATPAKEALEIIMEISDLYYELRGNVLRVKKYATKQFSVPHIPAVTTYQSDLGGDVLGGSGDATEDLASSLKGNFNLGYKRPEGTGDFYAQIEENIRSILGAEDNATQQTGRGNAYTLNRITGSLTVTATRDRMNHVEQFLDAVFSRAVKQVRIEAKIVDVTLADEWSYGIDWSAVLDKGRVTLSQTLPLPGGATAGMISVLTDTFSGVLSAIATYGKMDTLANPRLMVMNGQTALISAGTVTPYWEKETYQNLNNNTTLLNTNYTRYNVLDGILVGVTPYVNDDGTVTINIVPVSTSIQGSKSITNNNVVEVEAPILNIKEAGTVIRVDDGAMVVMGGLISTAKNTENTRIPILGDIPFLGYLFRTQKESVNKRELVIFLRPTIVYSSGAAISPR